MHYYISASFNGHASTLTLLLEAGGDPSMTQTSDHEGPYDVAKNNECREILSSWDAKKTVSVDFYADRTFFVVFRVLLFAWNRGATCASELQTMMTTASLTTPTVNSSFVRRWP